MFVDKTYVWHFYTSNQIWLFIFGHFFEIFIDLWLWFLTISPPWIYVSKDSLNHFLVNSSAKNSLKRAKNVVFFFYISFIWLLPPPPGYATAHDAFINSHVESKFQLSTFKPFASYEQINSHLPKFANKSKGTTRSREVPISCCCGANIRDMQGSKEVSETCSSASAASNRFLCFVLIWVRAKKLFLT